MSFTVLILLLVTFAIAATLLPEVVAAWLARRRGRKGS